jgi:GxxExxY protein
LLSRIEGALWLRLADRAFVAALLKLPPRLTRLAERSIRCRVLGEPRPPQGERVAVVEMRQHGAHAVGESTLVESALAMLPSPSPPAGLGAAGVLRPQPQQAAIDAEAEERQALLDRRQDRRARLQRHAALCEPAGDGVQPAAQRRLVGGEQHEVVHGAHVAGHAGLFDETAIELPSTRLATHWLVRLPVGKPDVACCPDVRLGCRLWGGAGKSPGDLVTDAILGSAIAVHRELGPGLLESAYEACLAFELESRGLRVDRQRSIAVVYLGVRVDCGYRMDLIVEEQVIVEWKAVDRLLPIHEAQLLSCLKLSGLRVGLPINFHSLLWKDGVRRLVL